MITKNTEVTQALQIWAMPQSTYHMTNHPESEPFFYEVRTDKPWQDGAVKVHEQTVMVTVPAGIDLTKAAVATLQEAITETRANATARVDSIQEQINNLLMLTHQPSD